jgi:hypothetical protein
VAGIVALLVITVAIVLAAGNRPPREYPAGSPEAALQAYLQALEARDLDRAWNSFSTGAKAGTTVAAYRAEVESFGAWIGLDGSARRVFIDTTRVAGDRAELDLTVEDTYIQGLSVSRNRYSRPVTMIREDGAWRFDRILMGLDVHTIERAKPAGAGE